LLDLFFKFPLLYVIPVLEIFNRFPSKLFLYYILQSLMF